MLFEFCEKYYMQPIKDRTKTFAITIIKLVQQIPYSQVNAILCRQLIRSATSIGANYRSALRGRSKAEFIAKLAIAQEESDESCYWLELLASIEQNIELEKSLKEAEEITAILAASSIKAKANR
jgi:four helix bundle protein